MVGTNETKIYAPKSVYAINVIDFHVEKDNNSGLFVHDKGDVIITFERNNFINLAPFYRLLLTNETISFRTEGGSEGCSCIKPHQNLLLYIYLPPPPHAQNYAFPFSPIP